MLFAWFAVFPGIFAAQLLHHNFNASEVSKLERRKRTSDSDPPDITTKCLTGWYSFGEKCFRISGGRLPDRLSWDKAVEKCAEYGNAELASIHSKDEQDFLINFLLLNVGESVWIGLHDRINESSYQWEDHSTVDFQNWSEFEPSGLKDEKEDCVEMQFSENSKSMGKWNDIDCSDKKPFICQMYSDPSNDGKNPKYCPKTVGGGYSFQDSCYHLIKKAKTWSEAENYCQSNFAGHLISVKDFTYQRFLNYILKDFSSLATLWIGIRIPYKRPLRWSSGWHVAYTKWVEDFSQQPTKGSCAVRMKTGHWDTESCDEMFPFICEVSSLEAPYLEPSTEGATCPEKPNVWKDLGGDYCYFFETVGDFTWFEANFKCIRLGGSLVSIHSFAEEASIEQFLRYTKPLFHIGFYKKYDGTLAWIDGSDVDYKAWSENEPNNKDELCVELITETMRWNDIGCETKRSYICSVLKRPPNATAAAESDVIDSSDIPVSTVAGVAICVLLVLLLLGICVYFCRPWEKEPSRLRKISQDILQGPKRNKPPEVVIRDDSDGYENIH